MRKNKNAQTLCFNFSSIYRGSCKWLSPPLSPPLSVAQNSTACNAMFLFYVVLKNIFIFIITSINTFQSGGEEREQGKRSLYMNYRGSGNRWCGVAVYQYIMNRGIMKSESVNFICIVF